MGQPRQSNNVRRIDFAKGGAKPSRLRGGEAEAGRRISGEHSKVVPLPSPQGRRRRSYRPLSSALTAIIVLLSALLGALTAAVLLDQTF